jgi:hypothetical protein
MEKREMITVKYITVSKSVGLGSGYKYPLLRLSRIHNVKAITWPDNCSRYSPKGASSPIRARGMAMTHMRGTAIIL